MDAIAKSAEPSSSQSTTSTAVEPPAAEEPSSLVTREIRRLKRDRLKEAKEREVKQRQQVAESESDDEAHQAITIYVAYHDWEHFSSVRNLAGPRSGPPNVCEAPAPASPSSPIHSRLRSSSMISKPSPSSFQKIRIESKVKPAPAAPALSRSVEMMDPDDSPPSLAGSPSSTTTNTTSSSGQLPSTPPDSTALSITPKTGLVKGRSPKRSFDETDDGGSGSEYGRKEGSKKRGDAKFVSPTPVQDDADGDEEEDEEENDSSFETSYSESQSLSQSVVSTRAGTAESPLAEMTKRQMRKMGKPRPQLAVLLVGEQKAKGKRKGMQVKQQTKDTHKAVAEWTRDRSGKLDMRDLES